jgi:LPS sulfotransferase NodH
MAPLAALSDFIATTMKLPDSPICVVTFHPGRCGSTVLGDLLDQHPSIEWAGEYYHRGRDEDFHRGRESLWRLYWRIARARQPVFGFEVKYSHWGHRRLIGMDWARYVRQLSRWGCKHFIFLTRRNILRNLVSIAVSLARQQWHQSVRERAELERVRLDVERVRTSLGQRPLLEALQRYHQADEEISGALAGRPLLRLCYEDDIAADPLVAYGRVCHFLGLEPQETAAVAYGLSNPFPLHDVIVNYDEVARVLTGTPFEWMLSG